MQRPGDLTRREFLLLPCLALAAVGLGTERIYARVPALRDSPTAREADPSAATPHLEECSECRGIGRITCAACDGTGMWTEASESAGLYQRQPARASGHCAWCDEWGETACPNCDALGIEIVHGGFPNGS